MKRFRVSKRQCGNWEAPEVSQVEITRETKTRVYFNVEQYEDKRQHEVLFCKTEEEAKRLVELMILHEADFLESQGNDLLKRSKHYREMLIALKPKTNEE